MEQGVSLFHDWFNIFNEIAVIPVRHIVPRRTTAGQQSFCKAHKSKTGYSDEDPKVWGGVEGR